MDRLREIETFVRIVESGSLSAAARAMGRSVPLVSKELAKLERRLGARLIARTSRQQAPTPEGARFHAEAVRILADLGDAEAAVGGAARAMAGPIRVTAPVAFAQRYVAPALGRLAAAHPELKPHLHPTDSIVDLVGESIDLAFRYGVAGGPGLVVRRLATNSRVVAASPDYVAAAGMPRVPEDLATRRMLMIGGDTGRNQRFVGPGGEERTVPLEAALSSSSGAVVHDWALAGLGCEIRSWLDVADDIRAGRLVRLLPDWHVPGADLHAVFPARRHIPERVRRVLDEVVEEIPGDTGG